MELDAVDGQFAVGEAHDFAFGGFGGDFEAGGKGFTADYEGVVAGGFEGAGEAGEDILAGVEDRGGFGPTHGSRTNQRLLNHLIPSLQENPTAIFSQ